MTRLLAGCGSPVLVCGGGPVQAEAAPPAAYKDFAARLRTIGAYTESCGIRTVYHPHLDTFIETREQLDRLMDELDTHLVGLCIDPAHFHVKRDDPVDVFRTYAPVIDYVHLKDCRADESTVSGYDRYLAFCELGEGSIDVRGIVDVLLNAGYAGVVTIEQDYSDTPDESCARNAAFIRDTLGLELDPGLAGRRRGRRRRPASRAGSAGTARRGARRRATRCTSSRGGNLRPWRWMCSRSHSRTGAKSPRSSRSSTSGQVLDEPLPELRGEQVAERVGREVAEQPGAPVHVLQHAVGAGPGPRRRAAAASPRPTRRAGRRPTASPRSAPARARSAGRCAGCRSSRPPRCG